MNNEKCCLSIRRLPVDPQMVPKELFQKNMGTLKSG
jgi:hypothetical protein